jgi:TRAP transporter TAXI family solute receptor
MFVTTGCSRPAASTPSATRPLLRVATAFAPLSTQLIQEYRRTLPNVDVREQQVPSSAVVQGLEDGTIDFGIVLANVAYEAYWRSKSSAPNSDSRIRGVSLLQPLPMYLLVRAGSGIHSVSDLKGRVIAVGARNNSSSTLTTLLLKAFHVEPVTLRELTSRDVAAAGLTDGTFDAIVLPGYVYPDDKTLEVIRDGAYLVPIDGPPVEELRHESPFVRVVMIPRDIYPGQNQIIPTVGIDMVIVCRRDLDDRLVYQLTEQLFNVFPRLAHVEAVLRFLNMEEAPATPIPLHPGAARYFRERELSR